MTSNYQSPEAEKYSPTIRFKFSINLRDNEMLSGKDHFVTLQPQDGKFTTNVVFGKQKVDTLAGANNTNLQPNTQWTVRLDMRDIFKSFKEKGYYTLFNGEKLYQADFKGVYIAGGIRPLSWDFNNLGNRPEYQLKDPDGDGIYETTLTMNAKGDEKKTEAQWELTRDISLFPQYKSDFPLSDAIYNMALEEMMKAVEPDSTFRTGKEWGGVWTRDISYSIILAMANLQPKVARYSLMRKVKNGRIIQDTGTGGAYPVSTDRMIWATAAWELYKTTGDRDWLKQAYEIIRNSVNDDINNAYDRATGLVHGESSFLDWREQTYPKWMQPVDIYESENLGTNAVHYHANVILSQMATLLNDSRSAGFYKQQAEKI
ncbi:MAG: glycogen debranching protein, partial [Bacteroidota bacterium]|nr:glycogen debranching protein [Bacteroidota bacterium]